MSIKCKFANVRDLVAYRIDKQRILRRACASARLAIAFATRIHKVWS